MVAIRLHRYGIEALEDSPSQVGVHRVTYEVAAETAAGGTTRLHRYGIEVLAQVAANVGVQRVSYEAAAAETGGGEVQLHRYGIEALLSNVAKVGVQRVSYEAAATQTGGGALELHRLGIEVLARTGVPDPTPLTLATDIEFFMHNWVDELTVETSFTTDVNRSPDTLAEERRSLVQRPERVLTCLWTRMGKTEIYQLRLLLRRLTNENLQIPLYPDLAAVTADAASPDTQIFLNTTSKRYYVGARVLIFDGMKTYVARDDVRTGIITELASGYIKIGTSIGIALTAGKHFVVPLIDCEVVLEPEITMQTAQVGEVELTVREKRGKNALPPLAVGLPPGFPSRLGRPVFEIETNWIRGVKTSYRRYGSEQRIGRRLVPLPDGDRYAQVQEWELAPVQRPDWSRIASMFDSRRGRAESFWALDREFEFEVANTSAIFIDVVPFGRFVDFNQLWTEANIAAAIRMKDGTIHLMQINTVSDNGSTWRLTAVGGQSIADPIDLSQIDFFARARLTRFDSDAMRETWKTNDVCEIRLSTVEVQNEKSVDFDA
jgi:hypothetical protein